VKISLINDYKSFIKSKINNDSWSQNYLIRLIDLEEDYAKTEMTITEDMRNFLKATHGAIIFALADQAFAAAANSRGQISVALNMSITFIAPPKIGEIICAQARKLSSTKRTGLYEIKVSGENNRLIAVCQGLVYRKKEYLHELK
jgi:acyl-CoA thioesterase